MFLHDICINQEKHKFNVYTVIILSKKM